MLRRARRLNLKCRLIFVSFAVILVRVTDYHSFGVLVVIGLYLTYTGWLAKPASPLAKNHP